MFKNLDFGLFWLQHASTRQEWYPASERTARLSYPREPLKEPKSAAPRDAGARSPPAGPGPAHPSFFVVVVVGCCSRLLQ